MNLKQHLWRIPIMELLVILLGITGLAGVLAGLWSGTESNWSGPWEASWWNGNFVTTGLIAVVISLISDLVGRKSLTSALVVGVLGVIGLGVFHIFDEPGDIGLGLLWMLGWPCVLSSVSSLIRRGLARRNLAE